MTNCLTPDRTDASQVCVRISIGTPIADSSDESVWLSHRERQYASRLRAPRRRHGFAAARWLAKCTVSRLLEHEAQRMPAVPFMQRLQVVGEQPDETTSRPVLLLDGLRTGLDVSITHTDDTVAAAVAESPCRIGIDLAEVRGVSSGLQSMWMKDYEIHEIRDSEDPDLTSAMNWSAREAAFKASDARDAFRPADWSVTFGTDQIVCSYRGVIQPTRIQFFRLAGGPLLAVATHGGTVPWVVFESPQCTLASQASREDRLNTATIFRDHPHD